MCKSANKNTAYRLAFLQTIRYDICMATRAYRLRTNGDEVRSIGRVKLGATTDKALAEAIGLHPTTLCNLLGNKREPGITIVTAILGTLEAPFDTVFTVEPRQAA